MNEWCRGGGEIQRERNRRCEKDASVDVSSLLTQMTRGVRIIGIAFPFTSGGHTHAHTYTHGQTCECVCHLHFCVCNDFCHCIGFLGHWKGRVERERERERERKVNESQDHSCITGKPTHCLSTVKWIAQFALWTTVSALFRWCNLHSVTHSGTSSSPNSEWSWFNAIYSQGKRNWFLLKVSSVHQSGQLHQSGLTFELTTSACLGSVAWIIALTLIQFMCLSVTSRAHTVFFLSIRMQSTESPGSLSLSLVLFFLSLLVKQLQQLLLSSYNTGWKANQATTDAWPLVNFERAYFASPNTHKASCQPSRHSLSHSLTLATDHTDHTRANFVYSSYYSLSLSLLLSLSSHVSLTQTPKNACDCCHFLSSCPLSLSLILSVSTLLFDSFCSFSSSRFSLTDHWPNACHQQKQQFDCSCFSPVFNLPLCSFKCN